MIYLNCIEDIHLKIGAPDKRVGGKRVCACDNLVKQIIGMSTFVNAGMDRCDNVWH